MITSFFYCFLFFIFRFIVFGFGCYHCYSCCCFPLYRRFIVDSVIKVLINRHMCIAMIYTFIQTCTHSLTLTHTHAMRNGKKHANASQIQMTSIFLLSIHHYMVYISHVCMHICMCNVAIGYNSCFGLHLFTVR